jgi:hypothetical protein
VALAHHDAAFDHQRRGGEAELVGAEDRADHTSRPVFIWPSTWTAMRPRKRLDQRLLRFRPGRAPTGVPACLIEDQGSRPCRRRGRRW